MLGRTIAFIQTQKQSSVKYHASAKSPFEYYILRRKVSRMQCNQYRSQSQSSTKVQHLQAGKVNNYPILLPLLNSTLQRTNLPQAMCDLMHLSPVHSGSSACGMQRCLALVYFLGFGWGGGLGGGVMFSKIYRECI